MKNAFTRFLLCLLSCLALSINKRLTHISIHLFLSTDVYHPHYFVFCKQMCQFSTDTARFFYSATVVLAHWNVYGKVEVDGLSEQRAEALGLENT